MVFRLIRSSALTLGIYGEAALMQFFGDDLEKVSGRFLVYCEDSDWFGCANIKIGLDTLEDLLDLQRLLGRSMVLIDDYTIQILDTALAETMYKEAGL